MSVVLSSITGQTKSDSVKLGDSEIHFKYKPFAITLGMSMQLSEGNEEMIDVLASVLDTWDVVEVEGEDFPPTTENLKKVPTELATLIATKVVSSTGAEVGEAESNSPAG